MKYNEKQTNLKRKERTNMKKQNNRKKKRKKIWNGSRRAPMRRSLRRIVERTHRRVSSWAGPFAQRSEKSQKTLLDRGIEPGTSNFPRTSIAIAIDNRPWFDMACGAKCKGDPNIFSNS